MQNVLTQNQIYKYRYAHGFSILTVCSILTEIHIQKKPLFPDFRGFSYRTLLSTLASNGNPDSRLACAHVHAKNLYKYQDIPLYYTHSILGYSGGGEARSGGLG